MGGFVISASDSRGILAIQTPFFSVSLSFFVIVFWCMCVCVCVCVLPNPCTPFRGSSRQQPPHSSSAWAHPMGSGAAESAGPPLCRPPLRLSAAVPSPLSFPNRRPATLFSSLSRHMRGRMFGPALFWPLESLSPSAILLGTPRSLLLQAGC